MAKIALMGHGVVGSGVAELLLMNRALVEKRVGEPVEVKTILDLRDFDDLPYADRFTKSFDDIINDDEISVVVEVMGGLTPAYDYVKASLSRGKSVVTSNKELVAEKGAELLRVAKENDVNFLFEASVGGGIPIIRPMTTCLAANEIEEIAGILNGTTNFILSKMIRDQMTFDEALDLARRLGYAERNPAADIDGIDACRKICILASLAFGSHVYPRFVHTEGISGVTLEDVAYAGDWGGVIKLIGCTRKTGDGVFVIVAPALIRKESRLAGVDDVFNGILVRGNATGDVVFYGKGAGKLPTASAVVADVIDAVRSPHAGISPVWSDSEESGVVDCGTVPMKFYLRCRAEAPAAVKNALMSRFGYVQYLARKEADPGELAFVVGPVAEKALDQSLGSVEGLTVLTKLRILNV